MEAFLKKLIIVFWACFLVVNVRVVGVVHYPEEGALCWEMELKALKERGCGSSRFDLSLTDLQGLRMQ